MAPSQSKSERSSPAKLSFYRLTGSRAQTCRSRASDATCRPARKLAAAAGRSCERQPEAPVNARQPFG